MRYLRCFLLIVFLIIQTSILYAQDDELIGGLQYDSGISAEGYILFSPTGLTATYLIDKQGQVVNAWDSDYAPASGMYLTDEGHLIRAGRRGRGDNVQRVIEEWDWDGNLVWQYIFESPRFTQHHDIQPMPNGNILVLAWEHVPINEAIALGFDIENLKSDEPLDEIRLDNIFEIHPPTDTVIWEWHTSDHLIQDVTPDAPHYGELAEYPQRINLNYHDTNVADEDITHMNSIAYHVGRDEIIVSVRSFSEVWVIDHSTTTEEARGSAGDLRYRWGNPQTYGQGTEADRILYLQHDARWLDINTIDSTLTVFNNGLLKNGQSHVIQFAFPDDWMSDENTFNPPNILWQSTGDFFAVNMSGGQTLPNENILITLAPDGQFIELTLDDDVVWEYINPVYRRIDEDVSNRVFRATFYPKDFIGFEGKDLSPQGILQAGVRE